MVCLNCGKFWNNEYLWFVGLVVVVCIVLIINLGVGWLGLFWFKLIIFVLVVVLVLIFLIRFVKNCFGNCCKILDFLNFKISVFFLLMVVSINL